MQQTCTTCGSPYEIRQQDLAFYQAMSPMFDGKRFPIPPPDQCPSCRRQQRMCFRNERHLYHRKCDATGKQIISNYSPDKPYTVYDRLAWRSDVWDPLTYGRTMDFSRGFFEQFAELTRATPQFALSGNPDADEFNSTYCNFAGFNRNCYMLFDSDYNEDCYYGSVIKHSTCCVDCSYLQKCELNYECHDCKECYNLRYSGNCDGCRESAFLMNCTGCRNCLFCSNLVQKQYCIENRQYTRENYEKYLHQAHLESWNGIQKAQNAFDQFILRHPQKQNHAVLAENSTGDYLSNVRDCEQCFDVGQAEDLAYCDAVYDAKTCQDVSSFGEKIERIYMSGTIGINCFNLLFTFAGRISCSDLLYCFNCYQSRHCFGCSALRQNEYCILNKQYTKETYEPMVARIIEHMQKTNEWGHYFPPQMSPFGYNETVASEYFPMTKEEALKKGLNWYDAEEKKESYIGPHIAIPEDISETDDNICTQILLCKKTGKPFRIMPQELAFYRKQNIPVPHLCPDERHARRFNRRNPRFLWERICAKCGKPIQTTYAPKRPEKVYCESCYLKTVY